MFSVLVIADDAGFFRRRRLFRAPQVRDVRVYGGLPFREIISARRRGKITARRYAKRLADVRAQCFCLKI